MEKVPGEGLVEIFGELEFFYDCIIELGGKGTFASWEKRGRNDRILTAILSNPGVSCFNLKFSSANDLVP